MIPSCPSSVNALYNVLFSLRRIELKPECLLWKSQAKQFMPQFKGTGKFLRLEAVFYYPMFYKNGKLKKRDSSNMIKLLQDSIAERYGLDDKFITEGSWSAINSEDEKVTVILSEVENSTNVSADGVNSTNPCIESQASFGKDTISNG
jgi:hypothetical protein